MLMYVKHFKISMFVKKFFFKIIYDLRLNRDIVRLDRLTLKLNVTSVFLENGFKIF